MDTTIADPVIRDEVPRCSVRAPRGFLPDEVIGESWFFRLLTLFYYYMLASFHGLETVGADKIDRNEGCLLFSRHSTHSASIICAVFYVYQKTGKITRLLVHRYTIRSLPILRFIGSVVGERNIAVSLLKSRFWVAGIPGGAHEAMIGHENAYKVCWPKNRKGFVHVATQAQVPIVPVFMANQEEMIWNPILYIWNLLELGRLFFYIANSNIPVLSSLLKFIRPMVWFLITWFQIPIPAKLTLYVGDPVEYDMSKDTIDDVVERAHKSLQDLINQHQPNGKSYLNAIKQRTESLKAHWQEKRI